MKNDFQKHKKNDKIKWVFTGIGFLLVFVMITGLFLQLFGQGNVKPSEWFKPAEQEETQHKDNSGSIVQNGDNYGMSTVSYKILVSDYSANGIAETVDSAYEITATIEPTIAENKTIKWTTSWKNANAEWAKNKNVTDYVTLNTDTTQSGEKITVSCLKDFGEQIIITATAESDETKKAICTVDYARKIKGHKLFQDKLQQYFGENGETKIEVDMFTPSSLNEYIDEFKKNNIWAGLFYTYIDAEPNTEMTEELYYKWLKTYEFSNYTILDFDLYNNFEKIYNYQITVNESFKALLQEIISILDTSHKQYDLSFENLTFSNNPICMVSAYIQDQHLNLENLNDQTYKQVMIKFVEWLKENPNTPLFETTITLTGEYSTFTKTYSFRYNADTVTLPVFDIELDKPSIIF